MMKNLIAKIFVIFGILGLAIQAQGADTVKIGFSIPKTGIFASAGRHN